MMNTLLRLLFIIGLGMLLTALAVILFKMVLGLIALLLVLLLPVATVYWLFRAGILGRPRWLPPETLSHRKPRQEKKQDLAATNIDTAPKEAAALAAEITRLVRKADRGTRAVLAEVPSNVRNLSKRVAELSEVCLDLAKHLRGNKRSEFLQRAVEMRARAASANDPYASDQYAEAARSFEAQAETLAELEKTCERLQAEIARILAALTNMRSRILYLISRPTDGTEPAARAADELASLEVQVVTFQESVRQVLQQARHALR